MWAGFQKPEGDRCACRPTRLAGRDPKTTPGSSGRADVRTPRRSEDHGGGQRHTEVDGPSSQAPIRSVAGGELPTVRPKPIRFPSATNNSPHRTRGQRPQAIELLRLTVRSEPKFAPSGFLERVLRLTVRSEPKFAPSNGVERLPAFRPLPEGCGRGLDSRKTRFLVAGFHTRFVPPAPFLTTLAVCSSPSPPTCFSRSRSWSFLPEEQYLLEIPLEAKVRRPALLENPLMVHPWPPSRGSPKRSCVQPSPGKPGMVSRGVPAGV
jgi:hypothetical protein